jgi:hypothetical protein
MITGPFEFIVGANDLHATAEFLKVFGFDLVRPMMIDEEVAFQLYGCVEARSQLLLSSSATQTNVRLVHTNAAPVAMKPFEAGGHGIDFYTTDIERALELASGAGGSRPSPVSWTIDTGRRLTEARIVSPDGTFTVFCVSYSAGGIPTILDQDDQRLFSEVTLTSWIIPADRIEREFDFWGSAFGYRNIRRTTLSKEAMVDLMQLPRPEVMGCSMFADIKPRCPVDLLWYPDVASALRDDWPLKPGLFALAFKLSKDKPPTALLDNSNAVTAGGETSRVCVYAGRSPGGIRYHLHP